MKTCYKCGESKSLDKFRGFNQCRTCEMAKRDERTKWIRLLIEEEKQKSCADCGIQYPSVAMDFDHVRGEKKFDIHDAPSMGVSKETLLAEIAKCELRCANCHRIKGVERGQLVKNWEPINPIPVSR